MLPVAGAGFFRPKFGGEIWIDAHGSCSYQCAFCNNAFFSAGSFRFHLSTVHPSEISRNIRTTDPLVQSNNGNNTETPPHRDRKDTHGSSNRFADAKTYNESNDHRRRHEQKYEQLMCTKCNEHFPNLERLRTHTQNHHLFECVYCPRGAIKSFETQQGLWSHQRNHHESTFPYKCKVCPRAFKIRKNLHDHTQIKHARGNSVKCDFCPKMLMSAFEKENHIKKYHSNRRYYCSLCTDYWSTNERNLRRHTKEKHPGQAQRDY